MKRLEVRLRRSPGDEVVVGVLGEHEHRVHFEYDAAFLDRGIELSPFKLPARAGLHEHVDLRFGPLPGLFDDSLPDGWGLLLMDRHFRRAGIDPSSLSALDRLAYLGSATMGALTYHPPSREGTDRPEHLLDLHALGRNAAEVLAGEAADVLPALLRAGGAPGGARPKVLVGLGELHGNRVLSGEEDLPEGFEHWIVKFAAPSDDPDVGAIEYAYSGMARAAGIDMPPTRLMATGAGQSARRFFAVRRFDRRHGNRRLHMHTFANLIHADFRLPSTDYADLFKVTRALTRNHADLLRLFRRMLFNVAAHNRDDHAKNFAFLLDDATGEWSLSPAYDLVPAAGPGGEHTMTVLGEGRQPTRELCLRLGAQFGIDGRAAKETLDEVNAAVVRWPEFAHDAGCAAETVKRVGKWVGGV